MYRQRTDTLRRRRYLSGGFSCQDHGDGYRCHPAPDRERESHAGRMPSDGAAVRDSDTAGSAAGAEAWNGTMDLRGGDAIVFECEIENDTSAPFLGLNEIVDDEMCVLMGETVGSAEATDCRISTTSL